MTEIVIQGIGGRMGHVLCDMIAQREDCRVVAGIDMKDGEQNGIPVYDSLEKLNGKGDVIIDFSSPAAEARLHSSTSTLMPMDILALLNTGTLRDSCTTFSSPAAVEKALPYCQTHKVA